MSELLLVRASWREQSGLPLRSHLLHLISELNQECFRPVLYGLRFLMLVVSIRVAHSLLICSCLDCLVDCAGNEPRATFVLPNFFDTLDFIFFNSPRLVCKSVLVCEFVACLFNSMLYLSNFAMRFACVSIDFPLLVSRGFL